MGFKCFELYYTKRNNLRSVGISHLQGVLLQLQIFSSPQSVSILHSQSSGFVVQGSSLQEPETQFSPVGHSLLVLQGSLVH